MTTSNMVRKLDYYVSWLLQVETLIPIGGDGALCVKAIDDYGVVYTTESNNIQCATCYYGKSDCKHIRQLKLVIDSASSEETLGLPELEQFQKILHGSQKHKPSVHYLVCLSTKPIPFEPVPESIAIKMQQQSLQQRLNIVEGICYLRPQQEPCSLCQ